MSEQNEKVKGVVDIVFVLDATASMSPCLEALKQNIGLFIDTLTTEDPQNPAPVKDWRARVFGYRDVLADAEPFVDNPFVKDATVVKQQLAALKARGGGDEPESLLDAIYKVATVGETEKGAQAEDPFKWRYRSSAARVAIAFTDATYHPTMSLPEASGGTLSDVHNAIQSNRIILCLFAPDMPCHDDLSAVDKCEYEAIDVDSRGPQRALAEFTSNQDSFRRTMQQLARSVSQSAAAPPDL